MTRLFIILGAVSGAIGVAAGAFGAHALRATLDARMLAVYETGARYQMYHALALVAVAWAGERWPGRLVAGSGWLFITGTALFSGSLYGLALTGVGAFGAVTPFGGACFIAGWLCLAAGTARASR